MDIDRLHRQSARHPAGAPQGRSGRAAFRPGARQPRWQGVAAHSGILSPG
jgi:hypothetical protein